MAITNFRGFTFPDACLQLPGFTDTSYGNDTCDSFAFGTDSAAWLVWVEAADPAQRSSDYPDAKRFTVCRLHRADTALYEDTIADKCCVSYDCIETDSPETLAATCRMLANGAS